MSVGFQAVQWNRSKIVYDSIMVGLTACYIGGYALIAHRLAPAGKAPDWGDLRIAVFGSCAFLMITIILCIGPLARLDRRFLPLLANRRHLGVFTFFIAALHGWSIVDWFAVRDSLPDLVTELTTPSNYAKFIGFPVKALGLAALTVFFVMAATSHDFWLKFLSPAIWKWLHMAIYLAYGLLVMHVALGLMQDNRSPVVPIVLGLCFATVTTLHILAAQRGRSSESEEKLPSNGWIVVGPPSSIPDQRAFIVHAPDGERIAVFRDGDKIGAVTNVCAHQNGPLGEGKIINGCITCPWHGWEYRLDDGCAPPPFTEKIATYPVRISAGFVEVGISPLPAGTPAALRVPDGSFI
jgi:nitrite reductase/ring-hydroxylating ferredoxin subunit/DMSO/TMAO reductase YedYZ heme-binding membrane subunit